jgi:hypothetical protein
VTLAKPAIRFLKGNNVRVDLIEHIKNAVRPP